MHVISLIHLFAMCRWRNQAKQEFTQGTKEHLTVKGIDCNDSIQEGLETLVKEMDAWVEQLRQTKVHGFASLCECQAEQAGDDSPAIPDYSPTLGQRPVHCDVASHHYCSRH